MSSFEYQPQGVCSRLMKFEIEDNKMKNLQVLGGCNGNLQGIGKLVEGMDIDDIISRVKGIRCGGKASSCPDQLAQALMAAKESL